MSSVKKGAKKRCCYGVCRSDTRSKSFLENLYFFISFPKPCFEYRRNIIKTTKQRHIKICPKCAKCNLWVKRCGRGDGRFQEIDHVNKDTYICSLHFEGESGPTTEYPDPVSCVKDETEVNFTFRGLMSPVFTVFNKDWSVNNEVIPKYAKFLADSGVPAVLVHGTSGEGMSMTVQERKNVIEAWKAAVQQTKQHMMVQVGGCPLPDAQELAAFAEKIGADSLLCLPELYFKPKTPQELIDYLKQIAKAAPNTPLLYYHIPAWSGVDINMEQFLNLSVGQIPTFQGIKYTSNDLSEGYNALKAANGRYAVFLGADTLVEPAFALGFDSVIATSLNIIPGHSVKIVEAIKANKVAEAREIQEKLTAACKVITKDGAWVPTMKVAMNLFTPIHVGLARPPLKNLTEAQQKEMEVNLKEYIS